MPISDVLKNMRSSGFPERKEEDDSDDQESTPRTILLSDDEMKSIGEIKPGEEVKIEVSGRLEEDGHFHVMSVESGTTMPDQEMKGMAAAVAGVPVTQDRTMPSPS
jgi:hypothetical protein